MKHIVVRLGTCFFKISFENNWKKLITPIELILKKWFSFKIVTFWGNGTPKFTTEIMNVYHNWLGDYYVPRFVYLLVEVEHLFDSCSIHRDSKKRPFRANIELSDKIGSKHLFENKNAPRLGSITWMKMHGCTMVCIINQHKIGVVL